MTFGSVQIWFDFDLFPKIQDPKNGIEPNRKNKWTGLICGFKDLGKLCFEEKKEAFLMDALGGCGGAGGFWGWNGFEQRRKKKSSGDRDRKRNSGSSDSVDVSRDAGGYRFPLKQAVTAGALTFTGDTIAQLSGRWKKRTALKQSSSELDEVCL